MSFCYTKSILKICIAQICQNIGWQSVQTSPMDILIDVLHRYLLELSKSVHKYSNQYGRTVPNLDDVALTFRDFGIALQEIEEYVNNVEPVPFVHKLPAFPVNHPPQLFHPKQGARELLHRPEHIPDYLPLMHPEMEEEDALLSPVFDCKRSLMDSAGPVDGESSSPLSSPKHGTKRPGDWSNEGTPVSKKQRVYVEDDGRPMREVTSVFMTPSGFISPARDGKAAEATLPHTFDSPPSTPEPPCTPEITTSRKDTKTKDSKRDKSSKSRKEKESAKKDVKKSKSLKKENKENNAISGDKPGTPSSSSKKDHGSGSHKSSTKADKSSKSLDSSKQKSKAEKAKYKDKESRDEHKKSKDSAKASKAKSKVKRSGSSGASTSKSPKTPKNARSPQKHSAVRSPKKASSKSPKSDKKQTASILPISPKIKPEETFSTKYDHQRVEVKLDRLQCNMEQLVAVAEERYREESPEPRLVIDDSIETQAKQEMESRIAVVDACIEAVIQRAQAESEVESEKSHRAVDDTIDEVIRGPVARRLEPKDIYDFTDSSELSSLSSLEDNDEMDEDSGPEIIPRHKEKSKTPDSSEKSIELPKKSKIKEKPKRKGKTKGSSSGPGRSQMSPNVIVKREGRSPSPIKLKDEIYSSNSSLSSPHSPSPSNMSNFFDMPPSSPHKHQQPCPASTSYSSSPFAPIKQLHMQSNPHFPTPPLFGSSKAEQNAPLSSNQPLNLAKNAALLNRSPDLKSGDVLKTSPTKNEDAESRKSKSDVLFEKEKGKSKLNKKEKKEKVEKKEKSKKAVKDKKEKDKPKIKEKFPSPKEKLKEKSKPPKEEKKVEKRGRGRPEKKKDKDREDVEDAVPKFTLKLSSGATGTGKFYIKPSHSHPSSPVSKESSPSPERAPSPPLSRTGSLSEEPLSSPSTPAPLQSPVRVPSPEPPSAPVVSTPHAPPRATHSRGRGRGRKPAAQPVMPPARTVITETLGTIVDESGNKIWICPACTRPDDGSAMIGCDKCDDWYHWVCVGIVVEPKEEEEWFCTRCLSKKQNVPAKRRRKKHKKEK